MDRPILFSAPMVRAILDGSKTQTRRVMKPQPPSDRERHCWFSEPIYGFTAQASPTSDWWKIKCPYGKPGDRLWVRESFAEEIEFQGTKPPYSDRRPTWTHEPVDDLDESPTWGQCHYRATDPQPDLQCLHKKCEGGPCQSPWKPSIHMPRWASRITLDITDVRVERLQDISDEDARAEGFGSAFGPGMRYRAFDSMWDGINGEGSWGANPWVWVVSFRRVEVR